jgi:hypothetical protein
MGSDDVLLHWKSAGAYYTYSKKKWVALLPFPTKAKVNYVECARVPFSFSRNGRRLFGIKREMKKMRRNV